MTLIELINSFRTMANDKVEPYFWSDEEVTRFLNEAQEEAVIRGRLILVGHMIEPEISIIEITKGEAIYPVPRLVYEILTVWDSVNCKNLEIVSPERLDDIAGREWRERKGQPRFVVQTDKWLRLAPIPSEDTIVHLQAYRRPKPMVLLEEGALLPEGETTEPEINEAHHRYLVNYALFKAFSVPDAEAIDPNRAKQALADFELYFGGPVDSDLRRTTREDVPHHVEAFWP